MSLFSQFLRMFQGTIERPSPSDWLPREAISVVDDEVRINLSYLGVPVKVWIPPVPDTNSMDGVFDIGNNNILVAGVTPDNHRELVATLKVGDVAVYAVNPVSPIIHRIIRIESDSNGKYYTFKGDNNPSEDRVRVRDYQIIWVSIGVIY